MPINQDIFFFVCFGHRLKVINHLAHENQKGSFNSVEPAGVKSQVDPTLKIDGKVIKFHTLSIYSTTYVFR
jgi:hypothetical protein